ncbi:NAD(P)-binding protein [Pleomassaria siparia CBS 279.74]|uniref:NAD(P)-binding protein n=1 Tax=Pleomassaria siparia CBS 279.74 TaxID=1314801 RepID=A0A6G1KPK1_9PLEO|nr:NAD(P)-binding protein [Pleomassaria siparia CBS 279.74]
MSPKIKDTILASAFTPTRHKAPASSIDPHNNPLPTPLTVCVIGASRGIGAEIAYAYAQAGAACLILVARSSNSDGLLAVEREVKELNPNVRTTVMGCDISSSSSVSTLAEKIKTDFGKLDIMVLNSAHSGPVVLKIEDGNPQDFQDVFDTNVQGTYLVAHYFIPLLKASEGAKTFLVVGSLAACITSGHIANTAYCVSKFAQTRLVEFIAEQYGEEGLLAIAVHPGAVLTQMAIEHAPDSFRQYLTDDPGLCGAFLVWICKEKRMWLNGRLVCATWDVDELEAKKDHVEEQDLLKWRFRV